MAGAPRSIRMARTLSTFFITFALAAPAMLDANIKVDGKKLRPHQQTFTIDGARVTVDLDRVLVASGDKVAATITAFSDTPRQLALDLRVVETTVQPGERVEPPSYQIDRETIRLQATPGGTKTTTELALGKAKKAPGQLDHFSIFVGPKGKVSPAQPDIDAGADSGQDYWQTTIEAGKAAAVDAYAWSGDNISMKVAAEGPIVAGKPFIVAITVKNTTGIDLPYAPNVGLETGFTLGAHGEAPDDDPIAIEDADDDPASAAGSAAGSDDAGSAVAQANPDEDHRPELPRGKTIVRRFRITPSKPLAEITLAAHAYAFAEEIGPLVGGAYDARTFHATEQPEEVGLTAPALAPVPAPATATPTAPASDAKVAAK